jgi:hypothetical protein
MPLDVVVLRSPDASSADALSRLLRRAAGLDRPARARPVYPFDDSRS